jgi:N-acylneuraminate cytidylyltransferase
VDRVVVSTDNRAIAAIAATAGAEIISRPEELAGDAASSEDALTHALDSLRSEGYEPDIVVFLQPTSPLRTPTDVEAAVQTLIRENADSLISVTPLHAFVWRREGGEMKSVTYDFQSRPRRQDIPEHFIENGSIYVFRPWVLRKLGNRLGGKVAVYPMTFLQTLQIDDPHDLALADQLASMNQTRPEPGTFGNLKLLAVDFDGVMTDNRVLVSEDGREAVWCNRGDGWGIARLREAGIEVLILSTEANPVVQARAKKLQIGVTQGCNDKLTALKALAAERGLTAEQIGYLGNDVNDLDCLHWVGHPIVVADASSTVLGSGAFRTRTRGGSGAVQEVADWILGDLRSNEQRPTTGGK